MRFYTFAAPHIVVPDPRGNVRGHSISIFLTAQLEETISKCGPVCGRATYARVPTSREHGRKYLLDHL